MSKKEVGAELKKELKAQLSDTQVKKKAKTTMMCHDVECERSEKTSKAKVPVYNQNKLRRSGRTYYFGPEPKLGAP